MSTLNALWRDAVGAYRAGQTGRAEKLCRQILKRHPDLATAHHLLGTLSLERDQIADGLASLRQAARLAPNDAEILSALAGALLRAEQAAAAEAVARRALAQLPGEPAALFNLALALQAQSLWPAAITAFRDLLAHSPDDVEAWIQLGQVHEQALEPDAARLAFAEALARAPSSRDARLGLARAMVALDQVDAAMTEYDQLLGANPGDVHARLGKLAAHFRIVDDLDVDEAQVQADFAAETVQAQNYFDAAAPDLRRQAALADGLSPPFLLSYRDCDITDPMTRFGDLASGLLTERFPNLPQAPRPAPGEPIRIGIVSGFIRDHASWGVVIDRHLQALKSPRFSITVYHTGGMIDTVTEQVRARVTKFVQGPLPVDRWVKAIVADRPHVLLYPELAMNRTAYQLAALRLAPLQATFFGHPVTSGLPTVDIYFSGDLMEPPEGDRHYRETLVRLPNLGTGFPLPSTAATSTRLGVPDSSPLILCCQTLFKYRPGDDVLLAAIARAVPDARFVFVAHQSPTITARLTRRLDQSGLPSSQTMVIDRVSRPEFAGLCAGADLYLDTPGFSSFNTALVALSAGLPVVALDGQFMRGRLAAGILRRAGLDELIAANRSAYVELAVALLQDPNRRRALRPKIVKSIQLVSDDPSPGAALADALEAWLAKPAPHG